MYMSNILVNTCRKCGWECGHIDVLDDSIKQNKQWNRLIESKPTRDATVYVCNINAGYMCYVALYNTYGEHFKLFDPEIRNHPPIAVTHWMYLPESPMQESDFYLRMQGKKDE